MKTLIIDGHIPFRETLIHLLQQENGFQMIIGAGTGEDGLELARSFRPDIILLEVELPDGSGLEVMEKIMAETPQTCVIFLTSNESDEHLLKAVRNGAKGFLLKGAEVPKALAGFVASNQEGFLLSPKIAQVVLSEFSQIRNALKKELEINRLTTREREVFNLLCVGASNQEIAKHLVVAENTVRIHVQNILKKLNLKNRRDVREKYDYIIRKAVLENMSGIT